MRTFIAWNMIIMQNDQLCRSCKLFGNQISKNFSWRCYNFTLSLVSFPFRINLPVWSKYARKAMAWIVLPKPISSAKIPFWKKIEWCSVKGYIKALNSTHICCSIDSQTRRIDPPIPSFRSGITFSLRCISLSQLRPMSWKGFSLSSGLRFAGCFMIDSTSPLCSAFSAWKARFMFKTSINQLQVSSY